MPALGIAQETGRLLQWMKAEGQPVTKGEVLMVVETDKTTVEIEASASGILSHVSAQVGQDVPVGQVIALIMEPGERTTPVHDVTAAAEAASTFAATSTAAVQSAGQSAASPLARRIADENHIDLSLVPHSGDRIEKADVLAFLEKIRAIPTARLIPASPKARRTASEHSVDLSHIRGSGPDRAVLYSDVAAVVSTRTAGSADDTDQIVKPGTVWRIMAERTAQSWTTVPHFYLSRETGATRLLTWRERAQKRTDTKITYTDLIIRLVTAALQEHPRVNAMWKDGAIRMNRDVNIGLAVAIPDGLVVPVIHRAQNLNVAGIAQQRAELVARAQSGKLKPDDLAGGTFTISNLGMYGIDFFNAIVNSPQAAILAVGRIAERIVPLGGQPVIQPMMTLTLSCDHRAVDGAHGAQFLQTLAEMIEEPLGLLE